MSSLLSECEYNEYVRKNEKWNFIANLADLTFYNLAASFIFGSTVLSLYADHLTDSAVLIGLIPAIQQVAHYLPQLVLARQFERLPRKKPAIVKISVMERLPYLFVALVALLWPGAPAWLAYTVLALSLALAMGSGGLGAPAWQNMLAKVIRPERRGRLFGLAQTTGGLLGLGGAAITRRVLSTYAYPTSFGICFLLAFGAQVLSWVALSQNREPARDPKKAEISAKEYLRRLPDVLRTNHNFAWYLVARMLIILGTMGTSFYVIYAREAFGVSDAFAADLTMVALVSQMVFSALLGWFGDQRGHKKTTEICTLMGASAAVAALLATSPAWFYLVFLLMSASTAGLSVASLSMIMSFSEPDDLPTYVGLSNTLLGIPIFLAPILGGWLVDSAGFRDLFWVALLVSLLGWGVMWLTVREPALVAVEPGEQ